MTNYGMENSVKMKVLTCCTTKSPPWFIVKLPNPTSDNTEVHICGNESTNNEDTPIELYVQ